MLGYMTGLSGKTKPEKPLTNGTMKSIVVEIAMHGDLGHLKIQRKVCFVFKRQLGCYQKQKDT